MCLIKRHKYSLILLIASIIAGCVDNQQDEDVFKGKDKKLFSTSLMTDSVFMRYPFRIKKTGSDLIISDLHGSEFYCYRFNYPQLKLKQSFAARGHGPNEFLDVENIRFNNKGDIVALDANRSMITAFDVSKMENTMQINLDRKLIRTLDFDLINDSLIIVPDYTGDNRLCLINNQGLIVDRLFKIPVKAKTKSSSNTVVSQAWRSFLDYNPENGILAMVTQLGHVVGIYNMNSKSIVKIVYGSYGEPEYIDKGAYAVPNGIMGYSDVQVGKNKIYALFWGRTFKDIRANPNMKEGGNMLEVYDLQGNPLCRYILDKYITGFCVDEKDNTMLALDINSNKPLIKYKL
jgi:hypothetical protein